MAGFDVIVCGSLHYDIVVDAPRLPVLDETLPGTHWQPVFGGKGRNQAVAARLFGAETAMIGRVGNDDFGAALMADLMARGVSADHVAAVDDAGSGMSVAIVDKNGDYGAVIVSGANLTLSAEAVGRAMQTLGPAKVGLIQNEIPEAANLAFARACRASGAKTLFNAAPARASDLALLEAVDVLIVNRVEAAMLAGEAAGTEADIDRLAATLAETVATVIVTLGPDGALLHEAGRTVRILGERVAVASTHGAGDAFAGALAARLAAGDAMEPAVRYANRAAARIVATPPAERAALTLSDFS